MKSAWPLKALSDICVIRPPKGEVRSRLASDDAVSFVPMEDLGIDKKLMTPHQVRRLGSVIKNYTYFGEGDVLIAKITPCFENGKLGIATGLNNGAGFGSSEFVVLRPLEDIDREFLYYYLSRPEFRSEGKARMGGAVGHQRVPAEFFANYPVPLPDVDQQRRTVAFLEESFDALKKAKDNVATSIQNTYALFASIRESVFARGADSWPLRMLGSVADVQSGGTPLKARPDFWNGGIAWYSSGELNQKHTFAPERTISAAGLSSSNAKLFPEGSLLIGMYDTAAMKMSILERDAAFNQAVAGVKPNGAVDIEFIMYALETVKPRVLLQRRGVRQKNLSLGKIRNIEIPVPPLSQQREVVAHLAEVLAQKQRLVELYQAKLDALEALRRSILHSAFTGELGVTA
jgi:type I restriction enzyme, S subunit